MSTDNFWKKSFERDIRDTPQKIWNAFVDISRWGLWNPGVKSIHMEGDFVPGVWFSMELPEGNIIRSQLIEVSEGKYFTDETRVGETMVRVQHYIEPLHSGLSRVIYIINTQGSDAQAFGEGVSADFPDVLAGLEKYLTEQTG
ncbi:SRPBCC family protein [Citrobacter portucalensis]|uniref:polyketide cyclase n=1 Tax=Citrobacter portucalensis TaxID=1639133 RepID=UPI00226B590E|nr:polyketide cyclase [Citrobacter portucalensis]MCX9020929.1 polyketide cyclase [Citrobacter portucalensis]